MSVPDGQPDNSGDPLRIEEQFVRAYGTEDEWLAYCQQHGIDPGPAFAEPKEPDPAPKTPIDHLREIIRRDRGGDAPPQIRGFA